VTPSEAERCGFSINKDGQRRSAFDLLSYPEIGIADIARIWPAFLELPAAIAAQLETDAKYAVYLERQAADVAAFRRDESFELPEQLDYAAVPGLSNESRQKLAAARPRTLGHAGRIDGLTPAALTLLAAYVRRGRLGFLRSPPPPAGEGHGGGNSTAQTCGERPLPSPTPPAGEGAEKAVRARESKRWT
jgi:tRNA uridine 5-carboxymethylaminomethyl modification enzyme